MTACKQCGCELPSVRQKGRLCGPCLATPIESSCGPLSREWLESTAESLEGYVAGVQHGRLSARLVGMLLSLARAAFKYQHENRQLNAQLDAVYATYAVDHLEAVQGQRARNRATVVATRAMRTLDAIGEAVCRG